MGSTMHLVFRRRQRLHGRLLRWANCLRLKGRTVSDMPFRIKKNYHAGIHEPSLDDATLNGDEL